MAPLSGLVSAWVCGGVLLWDMTNNTLWKSDNKYKHAYLWVHFSPALPEHGCAFPVFSWQCVMTALRRCHSIMIALSVPQCWSTLPQHTCQFYCPAEINEMAGSYTKLHNSIYRSSWQSKHGRGMREGRRGVDKSALTAPLACWPAKMTVRGWQLGL